jgi:hypothetical protein
MPRTVLTLNNPLITFADTQAALDAAPEFQCQVTQAALIPTANYNTIPSTGCEGASQSPGLTSFALGIAWLQDWTQPGGGLSGYAYDNDTKLKWFRYQLSKTDATVKAEGQVYVTAGSYGGVFGDGSPAANDVVSWPCESKPAITKPAPSLAESEPDDTESVAA